MLDHNDIKPGVVFTLDDDPYQVIDSSFTYKARGSSTVQAKIKNLKTSNIITRTFHAGDNLQEAELEKRQIKFIYTHRGIYIFEDSGKRIELPVEDVAKFLVPGTVVEGLVFQNEIINISLPIKMSFRVKEAPPGVQGDRASGGTKTVTLETGAIVQTPLFIETGDCIEINTQTSEYSRRVEKS